MPGTKDLSMFLLVATMHLYSLPPCEKNCVCTLNAHPCPGESTLRLLQSRDVSPLSAKKSYSSFVSSRQNVNIASVNPTEHLVPDYHFSEPSIPPCGVPQPQRGSRRWAGGCPFQGRGVRRVGGFTVIFSALYTYWHHPLLTPH